jgi:hypothetical protein
LCIEAKLSETAPGVSKFISSMKRMSSTRKVWDNKISPSLYNKVLTHLVGDTALQISYNQDKDAFNMKAYLHDKGAWTEAPVSQKQAIAAGQKLSVTIEVHAGKFNISFMEATEEIVFASDIPPWAANWLTVFEFTYC